MSLAILCSGQGRQHPDMFALTGDAAQASGLFVEATRLLGGRDPREVVKTGSPDALHHDRIGQILCTLQALAAAAALGDIMPDRIIVAGYSVGELAAWGVAGRIDPLATLDLADSRADAMDAVSQAGDGLLFVRGLARGVVEGLCERHGGAIAIINPGDAFILGGGGEALDAMAAGARAMNAMRVVMVPVEVASHTPRLSAASTVFREGLGRLAARPVLPRSPRLLSGVDAAPVLDVGEGLDKLAAQISHTVLWADCLQACVESGAVAFLELGPGSALSSMAAAAYPSIPARSLDDFRTLQGVEAWLARYAGSVAS
ncbi:MAG TPA: malonate decarboxylase subunit epsilon [Rhizobiaceae bacterium]